MQTLLAALAGGSHYTILEPLARLFGFYPLHPAKFAGPDFKTARVVRCSAPPHPKTFALAARWHQRGPATLHSTCSASSAKPPSQRSSRHCTMPPKVAKQVREKTNWLIHMLYIRQDYDQCLEKIEEALKGCNGMAECAPLPLSHTSHRRACSHAVTVARRPHLRQGTDQAPARRDPGLAAALPGGDLPQPAQHLQPEAGRPLALPPREAQGGARRVRGGAAHRHRRLGDLA